MAELEPRFHGGPYGPLPEQSFTLRIPADAPFTYAGTAVGFVWKARVGESRRWKRDAYRSAFLEVRP